MGPARLLVRSIAGGAYRDWPRAAANVRNRPRPSPSPDRLSCGRASLAATVSRFRFVIRLDASDLAVDPGPVEAHRSGMGVHMRLSLLARVVAILAGSAAVTLACAAEHALEGRAGPDGGLLDALGDSVGDALADDAKAGTRLRPRTNVYTGADGSEVRAWSGRWMDTDRAEECDAGHVAADGKRRCLPASATWDAGGNFFTDAKCSVPLRVRPKGAPAAKYLLLPVEGGGEAVRVIPVLSTFGGAAYTNGSGSCLPGAVSAIVGTAVNTGPEVAPSAFVEITLTVVD